MDYKHIENYNIKPIEPNFSKSELLDMGIVFIKEQSDVKEAVKKLKGVNIKENGELYDLGLTLSKIGPLKDSELALYDSDIDYEFIGDLWRKRNFYNITLNYNGAFVERVKFAYLSECDLSQDILYYIKNRFERKPRGIKTITTPKELDRGQIADVVMVINRL